MGHAAEAMHGAARARGRAWREEAAEAACALAHAALWMHGQAPASQRGVAKLVRQVRRLGAGRGGAGGRRDAGAYRVLAQRVGPGTKTREAALNVLTRAARALWTLAGEAGGQGRQTLKAHLERVARAPRHAGASPAARIMNNHTEHAAQAHGALRGRGEAARRGEGEVEMDRAGEMSKGYAVLSGIAAQGGLTHEAREWVRNGAEHLRMQADPRTALRVRRQAGETAAVDLYDAHAEMLALAERCERDAEIAGRDAALSAARCVEYAMDGAQAERAQAAHGRARAERRARVRRLRCETAQGAAVLRALREVPRDGEHGERMERARRALDAEESALEALSATRETRALARAITDLYASAPRTAGHEEHAFAQESASTLWEGDRARCVRAADHAAQSTAALPPALKLGVDSMDAEIEDTDARVDEALERAARALGDTAVIQGAVGAGGPLPGVGWTVRACDGRAAASEGGDATGAWTRCSVVDVQAPAAVYAVSRTAAFEGCVRALERYGTSERERWEETAEQIAQAAARADPVRDALGKRDRW